MEGIKKKKHLSYTQFFPIISDFSYTFFRQSTQSIDWKSTRSCNKRGKKKWIGEANLFDWKASFCNLCGVRPTKFSHHRGRSLTRMVLYRRLLSIWLLFCSFFFFFFSTRLPITVDV
ncbi:unnamed protein product [Ixodes pacificus]